MNQTLLVAIARAFRRSFETTDLSDAPGSLPYFPDGCCHWASYMIGHFLKYERRLEPSEVIGERNAPDGREYHSWLTLNGLVIDITSDEFADSNEPVIVRRMSEWHSGWKIVGSYPIRKIDLHDGSRVGSLLLPSEVYELVAAEARDC